MAGAMRQIYQNCFDQDTGVQTSSTANLPTTGLADGNNVAFSTYVKLLQDFDISTLTGAADGNNFTDFNKFANDLLSHRKTQIIEYLTENSYDVPMTATTEYIDTIKSIMEGLGLTLSDYDLDNIDGQVVLVGKDGSNYTVKNDLHIGMGDGSNCLYAGAGDDYLYGGKGDDILSGGAGADRISGGQGKDTLYGNEGDDTFAYHGTDNGADTIEGGTGHDKIVGGTEDDTIEILGFSTDSSIEEFDGKEGYDILDIKGSPVVKKMGEFKNFEELKIDTSLTTGSFDKGSLEKIIFDSTQYVDSSLNADSDGATIDLSGATITGLQAVNGSDKDDTILLGDNSGGNVDLGKGNDCYEGKGTIYDIEGNDTYKLTGGATIEDEDGKGKVKLNDKALTGGVYNIKLTDEARENSGNSELEVYSRGATTYTYDPHAIGVNLTIEVGEKVVSIKAFKKNGSEPWLGIKLTGKPGDPTFAGDYETPIGVVASYSPLILDLDGDGVETLGKTEGVQFDLDNNGFAETVGWAASDDGLLALDRNGDGKITGGFELFGNNTTLGTGGLASNGFEALAEFDDNGDGVINANDAVYNDLKVWRDYSANGRSESSELQSLAEAGVAALNLTYTTSDTVDEHGNEHRQNGSYIDSEGNSKELTDVWFTVDPINSQAQPDETETEEIQGLPYVTGTGNVRSLHESMALDSSGGRCQKEDLTGCNDAEPVAA